MRLSHPLLLLCLLLLCGLPSGDGKPKTSPTRRRRRRRLTTATNPSSASRASTRSAAATAATTSSSSSRAAVHPEGKWKPSASPRVRDFSFADFSPFPARDHRPQRALVYGSEELRPLAAALKVAHEKSVRAQAHQDAGRRAMYVAELEATFALVEGAVAELGFEERAERTLGRDHASSHRVLWPSIAVTALGQVAALRQALANQMGANSEGDKHFTLALRLQHAVFSHVPADHPMQRGAVEFASQLYIGLREFCRGVDLLKACVHGRRRGGTGRGTGRGCGERGVGAGSGGGWRRFFRIGV